MHMGGTNWTETGDELDWNGGTQQENRESERPETKKTEDEQRGEEQGENWGEEQGETERQNRGELDPKTRGKKRANRGRKQKQEERNASKNKEEKPRKTEENQSKNRGRTRVKNPRKLGSNQPKSFLSEHKGKETEQRRKERRRGNHFAPAEKEQPKGQWSYPGKQNKTATAPSSSAPSPAAQVSFHSLHSTKLANAVWR